MKNNTTRTLAIVVLMLTAATLVVGTFATVAATQTAFAIAKKPPRHDDKKTRDIPDGNSKNGNTVTIEECKNKGSASGFDTALDQECENLICTHSGNNATCVQEGAAVAAVQQGNQTTPVNKMTCEQCFTRLLTAQQIAFVVGGAGLPFLCDELRQGIVSEEDLRFALSEAGVSEMTANELVQCLKDIGIVFTPPT